MLFQRNKYNLLLSWCTIKNIKNCGNAIWGVFSGLMWQVLPFPITERVEFTTVARSLEGQGAQMRALSMLAWNRPVVVLATIERGHAICSESSICYISKCASWGFSIYRAGWAVEKLVKIGYERVDQVEQRGHFLCAEIFLISFLWIVMIQYVWNSLAMKSTRCATSP